MDINNFYIGQQCSMKRTFSAEEVMRFAELSQDTNPLHTDSKFAQQSRFGRLIVPGMLSSSLFSAIIGTRMPGVGSIYLSQNLTFRHPVYPDCEVEAIVTITDIDCHRNQITLNTELVDKAGTLLIEGSALILLQ